MTIDEAIIKHIQIADSYHKAMPNYDEAADHRQLAEWLQELKELRKQNKELKTLLQKALDDLDWLNEYSKIENGERCTFTEECENCPLNASESYCGWKYQAQALAAIQKGV